MKVYLLGMNHRSAPVEVRERFAISGSAGPAPATESAEDSLTNSGGRTIEGALRKLVASPEIEEAVLVSTCNRVEIVVTTQNLDSAKHRLYSFFQRDLGDGGQVPGGGRLEDHLYEHSGDAAIRHVFRVASSIDSMVVGEPQILGQLKEAYRVALESGSCGPILSRLFQRSFSTAKRVKNETRIAHRPVSVARVAVDLARQIFESLEDKNGLMIGAGEMIEMALFALQREGLGSQRVVNRTRSRAESLAARFNASAHGLDELDALLETSDVVLSCIGGDGPMLGSKQISAILRKRRNRPMFLIDMGVPRNVDASVNDLDNVYLYDIDDLQGVAAANEEERRRESLAGETIVVEEQERFAGWMVALQAVPTIRHLRARADSIRASEIERTLSRLELSDEQRTGVEALTRSIVNKILHPPLARLGAQTDREEGIAVLEEARALFGLDDPNAPGAEIDAQLMNLQDADDGAMDANSDGTEESSE